jgi:glycosyltransferase involved in cell wall biosynthesis
VQAAGRALLTRTANILGVTENNGSYSSNSRFFFVANAVIPTLQLSFDKPLAALVDSGLLVTEVLTEQQMKEQFGKRLRESIADEWITRRFSLFRPTAVFFCRYSGPHVERIIKLARIAGVPSIFHIDDDLLNVPVEIGKAKYEYHNHPSRLASIRYLLNNADLIYCSTEQLKGRLVSLGFKTRLQAGKIYCSGDIIVPAVHRPVKKIGYMGFDHAYDFQLVLPAIIQILRRHPQIEFELFGSIPKSPSLDEFGARVRVIAPVRPYERFLKDLGALNWDVGICPLALTSFNAVKANTKWVEYTSVGAAVVASAQTIYDGCCAEGCGLLATTSEEWLSALEKLVNSDSLRYQLVANAQVRLVQEYSINRLRDQVIEMLNQAQLTVKNGG